MRVLALPTRLWHRELTELVQRPRALAVKMLFPLAVTIPLLRSAAPAFYAAMALTMLVTVMAPLGAGAVLSRERAAGLTVRYRLLPTRPRLVGMERLLASSGVDVLQVAPVLLLVMTARPGQAVWWVGLWASAVATLIAGNVLGGVASTLARSPGEVMLYVLIPTLPALYLAGVFTPFTDPVRHALTFAFPFSYLHEAMLGSLGAAAAMPAWQVTAGGGSWLAAALGLAWLAGRRVVEAD